MTLEQMRAVVRRLTHNRDELTLEDIDLAINNALIYLPRAKFPSTQGRILDVSIPELEHYDTIILQSGVDSYPYPDNVIEIKSIERQYDATNRRYVPLEPLSWANFTALDHITGQDAAYYCLYGRRIYVTPRPSTSQSGVILRVLFYRNPTTLVNLTDVPDIAVVYHQLVAYLAAYDLLAQINDEYADNIMKFVINRLSQLQDADEIANIRAYNRPVKAS